MKKKRIKQKMKNLMKEVKMNRDKILILMLYSFWIYKIL